MIDSLECKYNDVWISWICWSSRAWCSAMLRPSFRYAPGFSFVPSELSLLTLSSICLSIQHDLSVENHCVATLLMLSYPSATLQSVYPSATLQEIRYRS